MEEKKEMKWVPSRFNSVSKLENSEDRMLFNSYTGALAVIEADEWPQVLQAWRGQEAANEFLATGLAAELCEQGFFVTTGTDEDQLATELHDSLQTSTHMHLVLMPTEACNFRCTYCYQTFPHKEMQQNTISGLKQYVEAAAKRTRHLSISWFGGEPLLAPHVISELSEAFIASCEEHGVDFSADISTNGYLLTKEKFAELLQYRVKRFMITIDGVGEVHDRRRKRLGGGDSYERIMTNLKSLRELDDFFQIDLRINFDEDNIDDIPALQEELAKWFKDDNRFQVLVRPVGRWGGPNNDEIPVCDRTASDKFLWELTEQGLQNGLALSSSIGDSLLPFGAVCYAAKPNSLIVGANGQLYKCSVALDDEMNHVGQLQADGKMQLDTEKIALWTQSGEEKDEVCRACHFRPACQGNHCPLYRMRTGKRPCPHEKRQIKKVLNLLWESTSIGGAL